MIATIAKKEMTEMFRDGRFRLASAVVAILLLASLAAGWKQYANLKISTTPPSGPSERIG
jgi:hypothetical protein